MLSEAIHTPEEYLAYSQRALKKSGILKKYKKISTYYYELCQEFKQIYNDQETPFEKWRKLLGVDAQIQILLELNKVFEQKLLFEFEEEAIINVIQHDKKSFYRELTGKKMDETPDWGLIYLSEE